MQSKLRPRLLVLALLLAALAAPPAAASGFGRFQHGGRATAQAGAMTARAADPSAVFYNPAAITRLPGLQLTAGADFNNATDEYDSPTGNHPANHIIEFPPFAYLTWQGRDGGSPWAVGIGLDTPYWSDVDFDTALFPARFVTRRTALELWEVHPVLAYALDDRWSIGGGVRYLYGSLLQGNNIRGEVEGTTGPVPVEAELRLDGDVDAFAFDLALHYESIVWGWGAVYRSGAELEDSADLTFNARDVAAPNDPQVQAELDRLLFDRGARQTFELPWEIRTGVWIAPYPELRLELDLAYTGWSELDRSRVFPEFGDPLAAQVSALSKERQWDDVVSIRLGLEGDVGERFKVLAGLALEPSPVPSSTLEPGFPRGDALVYAVGFSYDLPDLSFDLGVSLHDHDDRSVRGLELDAPNVEGTFSARDIVWAASARWRFE